MGARECIDERKERSAPRVPPPPPPPPQSTSLIMSQKDECVSSVSQMADIEMGVPESSVRGASSTSSARQRAAAREINHVDGYPKLAHVIGRNPEYAIVRRFTTLDVKLLLYLQAELVQLEHELGDLEALNHQEDVSLQQSVTKLLKAEPGTNGWKQWGKVQELLDKKEKYNKMLLQHEALYKLQGPEKDDIAFLHEYHSIICPEADHPENSIWKPDEKGEHQYDLISLSMRPDRDHFSIWFFNTFHPLYHKYIMSRFKKESDDEDGLYSYDEAFIRRSIAVFSIIISSALPTASIFALYFINSQVNRLVFVLVFSFIFSSSLAIFTSANRVEIFTAVVAMASVQVVFIGTSGGND